LGSPHFDCGFTEATDIATRLCLPETNQLEIESSEESISKMNIRAFAFVDSAVLSASVVHQFC